MPEVWKGAQDQRNIWQAFIWTWYFDGAETEITDITERRKEEGKIEGNHILYPPKQDGFDSERQWY